MRSEARLRCRERLRPVRGRLLPDVSTIAALRLAWNMASVRISGEAAIA